jgi:hypothetical protein
VPTCLSHKRLSARKTNEGLNTILTRNLEGMRKVQGFESYSAPNIRRLLEESKQEENAIKLNLIAF